MRPLCKIKAIRSIRAIPQERRVVQGMLEGSNTDTAQNMVDLIQTSREFEANQKVLSTANQTLSKAVNELGKI